MKPKPAPVCPHLRTKVIGMRIADGTLILYCLDCGKVVKENA